MVIDSGFPLITLEAAGHRFLVHSELPESGDAPRRKYAAGVAFAF
jgi:hypothetical protein